MLSRKHAVEVQALTIALIFWAMPIQTAGQAGLIRVTGPIGPAAADYIERAVRVSAEAGYDVLIIQLDTPGGLLESTKDIVQTLFASPIPTAVYVAPPGASAASAGTFITLAADIAAMAPSTTIGAAHPVLASATGESVTNSVMSKKVENYASSFVETIAGKRKRNVEWAIAAVRDSATLTAEQALATNVIDMVAATIPELLGQMEGRAVNGKVLELGEARAREIPMIPRERVFQLFWRPEVMFILMLVAIYGIIAEVSNPGLIVPGTVGVIALIVALYMGAVLPVNVAGVLLVILAIALFVAEAFTPTFGVLAGSGAAAFIVGGLMLFDRGLGYRVPLPMLIISAAITAGFFLFVIGAGLRAQRRPVRVGKETLLGCTSTAATPIDHNGGRIHVEGEWWKAVSDSPVAEGELVEIVGTEGLVLKVKKKGRDNELVR